MCNLLANIYDPGVVYFCAHEANINIISMNSPSANIFIASRRSNITTAKNKNTNSTLNLSALNKERPTLHMHLWALAAHRDTQLKNVISVSVPS
jgi:hypothetical protein